MNASEPKVDCTVAQTQKQLVTDLIERVAVRTKVSWQEARQAIAERHRANLIEALVHTETA